MSITREWYAVVEAMPAALLASFALVSSQNKSEYLLTLFPISNRFLYSLMGSTLTKH